MSVPVVSGPRSRNAPVVGEQAHPRCIVCGRDNPLGLKLRFEVREDGSVESRFRGGSDFEGYPRQLHGGIIALLLDGVMTHCLFARGQPASTGELSVRYRRPVTTVRDVRLRAWIVRSRAPLRVVAAELVQDGCVNATARAKFIDRRPAGNDGSSA